MSPKLRSTTRCIAITLLTGCNMPEASAGEPARPLDPAAAHAQSAVYVMRNIEDGETHQVSLKLTGDGYRGERSDGCRWLQPEPYAPSISWHNCSDGTGTRKITATEGTLWPLAIGNIKTWRFEGRNQKGSIWKGARICEVEATETVTLASGNFPSFRIHCRDPWTRRIYWYSPALGHTVYSQKHHKRRNENTVLEYAGKGMTS